MGQPLTGTNHIGKPMEAGPNWLTEYPIKAGSSMRPVYEKSYKGYSYQPR